MAPIQNLSHILRWLVWLFPVGASILLITGGPGPLTIAINNEILATAWLSGLAAETGLIAFMVLKASLLLNNSSPSSPCTGQPRITGAVHAVIGTSPVIPSSAYS